MTPPLVPGSSARMTDQGVAALNHLGGDGLQLELGPFRIRIRSTLPAVRDHLHRLYNGFPMGAYDGAHFDIAIERGRKLHRVFRRQARLVVDGVEPYLPLPHALAGAFLEWGFNWCIGLNMNRWVVVHAAVVERYGQVLVMPAASGSGKSTLCAALTYAGWRLLSDEFALVDPVTLDILPVPRPIALKNASIDLIRRRHPEVVWGREVVEPEGGRLAHAQAPRASIEQAHVRARPGCVLLPKFTARAATTFEPSPKAATLVALADQSFNFSFVTGGFEALAELIRRSDCYRLEYSDLDDALPRLDEMMRVRHAG